MAEFLRINLGSSFLLNAGILGLVNTLEYMKAKLGDDIDDDCDYIIDGQTLMLSEKFLLSHDMGEIYVKSIVEHLREYTNLHRILSKHDYLKSQIQKHSEADEKSKKLIEKDINAIYTEFVNKIIKLKTIDNYEVANNIDLFTKETDIESKYDIYQNIKNIINDKKNNSSLYYNTYYRDIMYSVLHYKESNIDKYIFYAMNFPLRKTPNPIDTFNKEFFAPLKKALEINKEEKQKNKYCCIECRSIFYHGDKKEAKRLSIMQDTVVDLDRKLSYYWNLKPDTYLCPVCAFVYTFVPLGFVFLGKDAIFVNNNSNIQNLQQIMSTYKTKSTEELQDEKNVSIARLYKPFTQIKADMLKNKLSNIQVIVKRCDNDHYGMNIIDNKIIANFNKSAKDLKQLEDKTIKIGDKYVEFYDEVFDNILFRRNQYNLIDKLLRYHLNKGDETGYIKNILQIQIIFWGGSNVDNMLKTANTAWKVGMKMRNSFSDIGEKDKDNKLRGLVYQLSNALTVGNREHFLDLVIRIYASKGVPIPYIFKNCFESDDMFKTIGYGYVLGLKASVFEKENNQGEQTNEE